MEIPSTPPVTVALPFLRQQVLLHSSLSSVKKEHFWSATPTQPVPILAKLIQGSRPPFMQSSFFNNVDFFLLP